MGIHVHRYSSLNFDLLNMYFPLVVLTGIYHYWIFIIIFFRGLKQTKVQVTAMLRSRPPAFSKKSREDMPVIQKILAIPEFIIDFLLKSTLFAASRLPLLAVAEKLGIWSFRESQALGK